MSIGPAGRKRCSWTSDFFRRGLVEVNVFDLIAGLALAASAMTTGSASEDAYARPSLAGFVAAASSRPLDGIDYSEAGALSAALLWSHPAGLFVGSELVAVQGDGVSLPDDDVLGMQTFAGLHAAIRNHRVALEWLDYRNRIGTRSGPGHQGMALRYRYRNFHVEASRENDRAYYYNRYDRFFRYDTDRFVLGWEQRLGNDIAWTLGAGMVRVDRIEIEYRFLAAGLHGRWRSLDWQLGWSQASDELEDFYGAELDRGQLLLRVAVPFRVF